MERTKTMSDSMENTKKMEQTNLEDEIKKVIVDSGATYDDAIFCLGIVQLELKSKATEILEKLSVAKVLDGDHFELL